MHYYQFHIGDYASHTRHLTAFEDLAYRRLLDAYYLQESPLNVGITAVSRQINMREHEVEVEAVLREFFELTESGWVNRRADLEIAKYQEFIAAGKRGAAKRWGKGEDKGGDKGANGEGNSPPNATPIATINHKPITNTKDNTSTDVDFERFWEIWPSSPRKVAKQKCLAVWKQKKLSQKTDQIINHVKIMRSTKQWTDGYDPAPLTYLNQGRYDDGIAEDLRPNFSASRPTWDRRPK